MASISTTITLVDNMSRGLAAIRNEIGGVADALDALERRFSQGALLGGGAFDALAQGFSQAADLAQAAGQQMAASLRAPLAQAMTGAYQGGAIAAPLFYGEDALAQPPAFSWQTGPLMIPALFDAEGIRLQAAASGSLAAQAFTAALSGGLGALGEGAAGPVSPAGGMEGGVVAQAFAQSFHAAAQAITASGAQAGAAMDAACRQILEIARASVNHGAGYAIGASIGQGLAAGIRSQVSAVRAAASALASAASSAVRAQLAIHSPSRVFYGFGEMSGAGYISALEDMRAPLARAAAKLMDVPAPDAAIQEQIGRYHALMMEDLRRAGETDYTAKVSAADAKRVRELAQREAINRFTTAQLHVEFTANNEIKSDMDIDAVIQSLEERVERTLQMAAEGVYA